MFSKRMIGWLVLFQEPIDELSPPWFPRIKDKCSTRALFALSVSKSYKQSSGLVACGLRRGGILKSKIPYRFSRLRGFVDEVGE